MTQESIERLGILEQNLSSIVMQRQSFQKQIFEIEQAISELKEGTDAYQIVGTIMIKKSAEDISKDLNEKKETLAIKIESIKKQEDSLRSQLKSEQDSVMAELNKGE